MSAKNDMPKEVDAIASSAFQIIEALSTKAVVASGQNANGDGTMTLFTAIAAAGGALRVMADIMSRAPEGEEERWGQCTKETMLVAALVVGRIVLPHKEGVTMDFSPRNVLAAIEAASKIAGRDLSTYIDDRLLSSYREGTKERGLTLGYWDYVPDAGPSFEGFGDLDNYMKTFSRH